MNIASFLLPKERVAYADSSATMQEAVDILERCHYSAIPVIDKEGKYIGTLSVTDLFWKLKNTEGLDFSNLHNVQIVDIKKTILNESVWIHAQLDDMLALAADQNFVPVVDEKGIFLGIIRRKDIIEYYTRSITD